jgi:SAM-dependent methyltransferase
MNPSMQTMKKANTSTQPQSETPFNIEDLNIFDDDMLQVILRNCGFGLTVEKLARSLHGVNDGLIQRIERNLLSSQLSNFLQALHSSIPESFVAADRRDVLQALFWELTYWKTPDLYEELIAGEQLHPGIFQQLEPEVHNKVVLDAGAGSGRATFECVKYGARKLYAVEPSPGLLHILRRKITCQAGSCCVSPLQGRFDKLPLEDNSVDTALSCSAFTSDPVQGGESGLTALRRVIKPGGKLIIIWPRAQDHGWFNKHSFCYVELPLHEEMLMRFRTLESAMRCVQHFYANNAGIVDFIRRAHKPEIPFSMLGLNPPCDYYWLRV